MTRMMPTILPALIVLALASPAGAQTSASHKLTEYTFNDGGDPANGSFASSTSHRIKLDAIGDAVATDAAIVSTTHRLEAGFVGAYPPPVEVRNARFTGKTSLVWDPDRSVGSYEVYRDALSTLPGNFGACFQSALGNEVMADASNPSAGTGWFYLVTARNRLGEEGTKGNRSSGAERSNALPCP